MSAMEGVAMDQTDQRPLNISRRRVFAVTTGAMTAATTASWPALGQPAIVPGGIFVVAVSAEPASLNPMLSQALATFYPANQIFDTLVKYDSRFQPVPWLAKSWKVSPDGTLYEFEINSNVRWHDGTPFSNDDIVFTLKEMGPKYSNTYNLVMKDLSDIDATQPGRVVLKFARPVGALLSYLGDPNFNILPKHIYAAGDPATNPANSAPVGTGPFMFREWIRGERLTLAKNPNYWQPGLPHFDTLVFRRVPNSTAAVSALEQGGVQLFMSDIPPVNALALKGSRTVTTLAPSVLARTLDLWPNLRSKPLADLSVRQALSLAMDRPRMVTNIGFDQTVTARGPVGSRSPYFDQSLPELTRDVARANALLDGAGYPRAGQARFTLNLRVVSSQSQFVATAQIVKENLADVGVNVNIIAAEQTTTLDAIFKRWEFDLAIYSMPLGPEPALQLPAWLGTVGINRAYFSNAQGYSNELVDSLTAQAQQTVDTAARTALYNRIQQQIMADLPLIPLWEPVFISGHRNEYVNVFDAPDERYLSLARAGRRRS
jgi:peptide/nickel transport system substrate-binding protein